METLEDVTNTWIKYINQVAETLQLEPEVPTFYYRGSQKTRLVTNRICLEVDLSREKVFLQAVGANSQPRGTKYIFSPTESPVVVLASVKALLRQANLDDSPTPVRRH